MESDSIGQLIDKNCFQKQDLILRLKTSDERISFLIYSLNFKSPNLKNLIWKVMDIQKPQQTQRKVTI